MPKVVREYKTQARERILDAAATVFRREGLIGGTMDVIARELGVSKGALYLYFPSKAQLLNALLKRSRDQAMRQLNSLLESGDVAEGIANTIDDVLSGEITPSVWNQIMADAASDPEVQEALRRDQRDDVRNLRSFLKRLESRGRIPSMKDSAVTTDGIILLLTGTIAQIAQRGEPADHRRRLVRALRLVLRLPPSDH